MRRMDFRLGLARRANAATGCCYQAVVGSYRTNLRAAPRDGSPYHGGDKKSPDGVRAFQRVIWIRISRLFSCADA